MTLYDSSGRRADRLDTQPTDECAALEPDVARLVIAAREVAFGGYFDGCNEEQRGALKELDSASEAFAARVPWEGDASADTRPKGGDAKQAPFTSGATAKPGRPTHRATHSEESLQ